MGQKKSQKLDTLNMNGPLVTARIIGEQLGSKNPVIVAFGLQDNQRYTMRIGREIPIPI